MVYSILYILFRNSKTEPWVTAHLKLYNCVYKMILKQTFQVEICKWLKGTFKIKFIRVK